MHSKHMALAQQLPTVVGRACRKVCEPGAAASEVVTMESRVTRSETQGAPNGSEEQTQSKPSGFQASAHPGLVRIGARHVQEG